MSSQNGGVCLVGSIPRPIGGVTQHVWRLSLLLAERGCTVCDMHPDTDKYATAAHVRTAPRARWLRLPWMIRELTRSSAEASHLHFSSCAAVGLTGLMLKLVRRDHFRMLTLHHGDQRFLYGRLGSWFQARVARALHGFDRIVCLTQGQYDFYRDVIRIPAHRLVHGSSYVPFLEPPRSTKPISDEFDSPDRSGKVRLVASGYPSPFYHHERAIELTDKLRREVETELYLCLYGKSDHADYQAKLADMIAQRPYVHLKQEMDFFEFTHLLRSADVYLRPTTVDSYGIAVADAVMLGVPVVASDVCQRHPGAILFPTGDFAAFEAAVRQTLDQRTTLRNPGQTAAMVRQEVRTALQMYDDTLLPLPNRTNPPRQVSRAG